MNNIDRIASMLTEDPDVLNEIWGAAAGRAGAAAKRAGTAMKGAAQRIGSKFAQRQAPAQPAQAPAVQAPAKRAAPSAQAQQAQAAQPTGLTARNPEFAHLMSELMVRMKQRGEGTPISKRLRSQYGALIQQMQKSGLINIQPVNTLMLTPKGQDMAGRIDSFLNTNRGIKSTAKENQPAMPRHQAR